MPFHELELSVKRGCLSSADRPDRISSGTLFAAKGGYSGTEYDRGLTVIQGTHP